MGLKRAKIIKGKKPAANEAGVPEDELVLAQLIQNVAGRKMHSVKGGLYGKVISFDGSGDDWNDNNDGWAVKWLGRYAHSTAINKPGSLKKPPKGADCACVLGAQLLSPKIDGTPITVEQAFIANDCGDGEPIETYVDDRSASIGIAFEQALRPEL